MEDLWSFTDNKVQFYFLFHGYDFTKYKDSKIYAVLTIAAYFAFLGAVNFQPRLVTAGLCIFTTHRVVITPSFYGNK